MGWGNTQHTEFCPVYSLKKVTFTFLSSQGLVIVIKAISHGSQGLIRKGGRVSVWFSCDTFGALRHS